MKKITIIRTVLIAMAINFDCMLSWLVGATKPTVIKQKSLGFYSLLGLILMLMSTGCLTPLMKAVNKNDTKTAETLIASGANVNEKSIGSTPLYTAVSRENAELVKVLLDKGADVNEKGMSSGWRPIHIAVKKGNVEIVKLLLAKGVDISVPNPLGKTPLTVAEENGSTAIVNLLKYAANNKVSNLTSKDTAATKAALDSIAKTTTALSNTNGDQGSKSTKKEKILTPSLRIIKPIPSYISETALSNPGKPSSIKENYGKTSSFGFGVGVDAKVQKNIRLFADMTSYKFKEELVKKGEIGGASIGIGYSVNFPDGAKYKTQTTSIRFGAKYVYTKNKSFQPWIGLAYGINIWNVKYVTWDEDKVFGKANGSTGRAAILAGIDLKAEDVATFTFFFEAISPVANYTMSNLFGVGDFHCPDGMTYPTPRIGLSIGGF